MYGTEESAPIGGDHGAFLAALAAFLKPKRYLELGIAGGECMRLVAPHCGESIAVDIEDVAANLVGVPRCRFIRGDSVDVLRTLEEKSFDLVFLDSSHEFKKTVDEIFAIDRILAPNGVVCLHDTYPPNRSYATPGRCVDVWKATAMLPWEHMTLAAEYGVTICRKSLGRQLLWREP